MPGRSAPLHRGWQAAALLAGRADGTAVQSTVRSTSWDRRMCGLEPALQSARIAGGLGMAWQGDVAGLEQCMCTANVTGATGGVAVRCSCMHKPAQPAPAFRRTAHLHFRAHMCCPRPHSEGDVAFRRQAPPIYPTAPCRNAVQQGRCAQPRAIGHVQRNHSMPSQLQRNDEACRAAWLKGGAVLAD
jgi:hypothetical protein